MKEGLKEHKNCRGGNQQDSLVKEAVRINQFGPSLNRDWIAAQNLHPYPTSEKTAQVYTMPSGSISSNATCWRDSFLPTKDTWEGPRSYHRNI